MTNDIQKQYDRLEGVRSIMLCMKELYAVPDRHIRYATTKAFFGTKMAEGSSVQSHGFKMLSLVEKLKDLKKKGKGKVTTATASADGAPTIASGKGKGKEKVGGSQWLKANDVCMYCQRKGHWKRECPQLLSNLGIFVIEVNMITNAASWVLDTGCGAHICNNLQVLERSRKLSKDEMILRLSDGKAVAAEAVGSLNLVISDDIRIKLKDCYYDYALETAAKLLNIPPSKMVPRRHTKYGMASLRITMFLKKDFDVDSIQDEVLLEESSELPQQNNRTSFEPSVPTKSVPALRRSTRESRPLVRYRFMGLTIQLDNDPKTYEEAMSDIDSNKWLEAMKSEMDSMDSNHVWTLVDPLKGVKLVGCKWVYKRKLGANDEVTAFKARLMAKGYT
ncbi:UNVERIFIED_CONTAM: Retrovirus-related Pol polyprotein from transposon TNT 1-94 [Sesamum calycinum]|uniref:Retrovirus-related Pol polyprotein from transposon TNT 1-94 n=1 Tax=Sesamum calycinum TaxID=2727403 RepID=A0AAW2NSU8_9LAMI